MQRGGYYSVPQGRISGAGVMLVSYIGGKVPSVVLIHSKDKQAFEEPGGGSPKRTWAEDYGKIRETARSELFEETAGLIDVSKKKMYKHFIDVRIKRSHNALWFYRTYVMHIGGITRQDFFDNLEILKKHPDTPKCFLESDDLVVAPLKVFQKIYKIQGKDAIKVGDEYIPISKRLKHIMKNGGLDLAAKVLLTTRPNDVYNIKINRKGWKKGTQTFVI